MREGSEERKNEVITVYLSALSKLSVSGDRTKSWHGRAPRPVSRREDWGRGLQILDEVSFLAAKESIRGHPQSP